MIKEIYEFFSFVLVGSFSIYIFISRDNLDYQWLYFFLQSYNCLFQSIFVYNLLDNISPGIIYPADDYRISFKVNVLRFIIFISLLILLLFSLFITILYAINFDIESGNYFLLLLQPLFFFSTCLYFLHNCFSDFSGWSYCDYYQSKNTKEIKYHLMPRSLVSDMMQNYLTEQFLMDNDS